MQFDPQNHCRRWRKAVEDLSLKWRTPSAASTCQGVWRGWVVIRIGNYLWRHHRATLIWCVLYLSVREELSWVNTLLSPFLQKQYIRHTHTHACKRTQTHTRTNAHTCTYTQTTHTPHTQTLFQLVQHAQLACMAFQGFCFNKGGRQNIPGTGLKSF